MASEAAGVALPSKGPRHQKTEALLASENYNSAKKRQRSTQDLLNLAVEVRETATGQLVSGRSKIQDVMAAEVSLAEARISHIIANSEVASNSIKINAISGELLRRINWSPGTF